MKSIILGVAMIVMVVAQVVALPSFVQAQANLGGPADLKCLSECAARDAEAKRTGNNAIRCTPTGTTKVSCSASGGLMGGTVNGVCVDKVGCKALTASGADGKSMNIGDLSKLIGVLGQVMQALNAGGAAGGSGSGSGTGSTGGYSGCSQYYQVSTPSSDPCAYYVPPTSSSINIDTGTGGSSSGSGSTGSGSSVTDLISGLLGGTGSSTGGTDGSGGSVVTVPTSSIGVAGGVSSTTSNGARVVMPDGTTGELRVLPNGATIIVRTQNTGGNSVVAGFLGSQTMGGAQPTGLVATWCRSRPWSSNFLSIIIPAKFFDNLCTLNGYQVGIPTPAVQTQIVQQNSGASRGNTSQQVVGTTTRTPNVPASPAMTVDIWAVPAAVPLGARTTVFWNSKNAQSCIETSPDGSFSHSTLSGGGATVPLAGATTFTISCQAPDGTHATDYVTVNLSM